MTVKKTAKKQGHRLTGPGPGRPKGVPNKLSRTARENIEKVFEDMGGAEGMKQWAERSERNRTIFYSEIFPKLIPLDVSHGGGDKPIQFEVFANWNGNGK